MTTSARIAIGAALAASALLPPVAARAESRPEEDVTPLSLARRADAVLVVVGAAPADAAETRARFEVVETLRGTPSPGDVLEVPVLPDRQDLRAAPGERSVALLLWRPDGRWAAPAGALSLFPAPDDATGAETLALFRALAAEGTGPPDAVRLRAALVRAVGAGEARVRAGAALDLLQEPGLLEGAAEAERAALVARFDAEPNRSRARFHLARIVGLLRPAAAAERLVDALLAEGGEALRPAVADALRDLGDPRAVALLASRTASASARDRIVVAGTLGALGGDSARAALEALLPDAVPEVRREAAASLGMLRDAASAPALLARFRGVPGGAGPEGDLRVRRALAWALAQADDPGAWGALRAAAEAPGESLRAFLEETLANPRRAFVR